MSAVPGGKGRSPLFPEGKDEVRCSRRERCRSGGCRPRKYREGSAPRPPGDRPVASYPEYTSEDGAPAAVQRLDPEDTLDLAAITCRKRRNTMLLFPSGLSRYHQG